MLKWSGIIAKGGVRVLTDLEWPVVALAPMAGVTDSAFRRIAVKYGCGLVTTEMISARALVMGDRKTPLLMQFCETERPLGIQLFGYDPDDFSYAAEYAVKHFRPDFIDINMGCPTPKITGNGSGSALMKDPDLAAKITEAARVTDVPVTVKMRTGYDKVNAPVVAEAVESAGAMMITVHGRTRDGMYHSPIDYQTIAEVKSRVKIPVIGNGNISCGADARHMMDVTGCDGVAVGRAAQGDPFVFAEISAYLKGKTPPDEPDIITRMNVLREQVDMMLEYKSEYVTMQEARKHTAWYLRGVRDAAKFRAMANGLNTVADLDKYIVTVLNSQE